jgi:nitrogenase molybdenum-iron protein alpha/beta subunit
MDSLIVFPENEEQLTALKAVMAAMKITFEQKSETYPAHVIEGVKKSLRQADNGELTPYTGIRSMLNKA